MDTDTRQIHNFQAGELFDRHYWLLEHVGSGGFADVWRAKDELVDTIVALKIYTRLDSEGISELAKEYKDMRGIKHPNLLTGNHFDASGNIPYLEMDYCDGGSLYGRMGKMSDGELRHILRDVCSGLAYLHREGIVHQDIKPENILYDTEKSRYLLSDFGISGKSRTRLSHSVNKANMTLSMTEAYAPPEKFSGNFADIAPDTKGDIFSLGMTMYELAVGQLPFTPPMATGRELLYSQGRLQLDYSQIHDPQLRHIVQRCMAYRKEDRPTASEVLAMVEAGSGEPIDGSGERQRGERRNERATEKIKMNREPKAGSREQVASGREKPSKGTAEAKETAPGKWSWGAFAFGGIWGLFNGVPLYALEFVLFAAFFLLGWNIYSTSLWWKWHIDSGLFLCIWILVHIIIRIIFGIKGTKRAWSSKKKRWESKEKFAQVQRKWNRVGRIIFGMLGIPLSIGYIALFVSDLTHYHEYNESLRKYKNVYVDSACFIPMIKVEGGRLWKQTGEAYEHGFTEIGEFYIGREEVTQEQWMAVMGDNPSCYQVDELQLMPVEQISYKDIQTFIGKLNDMTGRHFRLPTEDEWEFAARGGNESRGYTYSGSDNIDDVAWYSGNCDDDIYVTCAKQPNELGLYDMSGGVWEWCTSSGEYTSILRGGGRTSSAERCRVNSRINPSRIPKPHRGFRLAMDAD